MNNVSFGNTIRRGALAYVAMATWAVLVVAALGGLAAYSFAPGPQSAPPPRGQFQPSDASNDDRFELVMAVHPKCPCTRASVGELARLVARFPDQLRCTVLAYRPANADADWDETVLIQSARQQPHTTVVFDDEGKHVRELGMSTSGSVILYSPAGKPEYWGGITMARGHAGDSIGSDAIHAILTGRTPDRRTAPVFGCAIYE
jgi:hypothetical protein